MDSIASCWLDYNSEEKSMYVCTIRINLEQWQSTICVFYLSLCVRQHSFCVSNQLNTLRVDISLVVFVVVSELTIGSLLIIYIWARASIENQRRCYNVATATPTSNTLMGSLTLHHKYLNRLRHGNGYKRQALGWRILIILDTFCEKKKFFLAMK